jgi:hypothetical protein
MPRPPKGDRPMTAAEKKRNQRAELGRMGLRQVTVTWPISRLSELRELEEDARDRQMREMILGDDA